MENATKALLIAAAVLIAILLISLGVGVFNTASEQMGNADLSEYEIQKFNDKFTQYEGKNVSGSEANSLLTTVFNHNLAQEDSSTMVTVGEGDSRISDTTDPDDTANIITIKSSSSPKKYSTGKRYSIECKYDTNSKLVTHVKITENTTQQ